MEIQQQIVNALTLGSVYALFALGYSMVYGILEMLNFAHGEVFMIGGFIGYLVALPFVEGGTSRRTPPSSSCSCSLRPPSAARR